MFSLRSAFVRTVAAVVLVAVGFAAALWWSRPTLTEEAVRRHVVTTIQQEAPASFYVTGYLDIAATVTVENTRYLFPGLLELNLGTTRSTVRVPGRVSYGFDVRRLRPEAIRLHDDGVVEVTLPPLALYSVEPQLDEMAVQTSVGWARLRGSSGQRVERQAVQLVQEALEQQGARHLQSSAQPRLHTAKALETLLRPVLEAAGVAAPRFRFRIGPELVYESAG